MSRQSSRRAGGETLHKILDYALAENPALVTGKCDGGGLSEVFSDSSLADSCMSLFENDLNVSLAAENLYMHRNTLLYRIKKIKRLTGLDVTNFSDAVTFIILFRAYQMKNENQSDGK